MLERVSSLLGSKRFAVTLLKAGAAYLLYLAVLGFLDLRPPAQYMVWGPFALWGVLLLTSLSISMVRDRYVYKGNLVFHGAFLVVAAGAVLSAFYRFEGEAVVIEGESFFAEENEYIKHTAGEDFDLLAPNVSLKVSEITPEFWEGRLYFTGLTALVKHPATTLEKRSHLWLNSGPRINGTRLRLTQYGIFPELLLEVKGNPVMKGPVRMNLFPPGHEDFFDIKNYRIRLSLYTDYKLGEGGLENSTMNLVEPLLLVKVEWFGRTAYEGALKKGQKARFGDVALTFSGVKKFVGIGVVKDDGEIIVFAGFVLALAGLALRVFAGRDRRPPMGAGGVGEDSQ